MEMCLGDQQYVTNTDKIIDHIEVDFTKLKNIKIKSKKCHFFQCSIVHIISRGYGCKPLEIEKVKNWAVPTNPKDLHLFVGLIFITFGLYLS